MFRALLASLIAAPLLGACVFIDAGEAPGEGVVVQTVEMPGEMEVLYAAAFTREVALFQVNSNGCTAKEDFVVVPTRHRREVVLTLRRTKPDLCKALRPEGVELTWSLAELGLKRGDTIRLSNPFSQR